MQILPFSHEKKKKKIHLERSNLPFMYFQCIPYMEKVHFSAPYLTPTMESKNQFVERKTKLYAIDKNKCKNSEQREIP